MNRRQSDVPRIRGSIAGNLQPAAEAIRPSGSSTELRHKVEGLWNEIGSLHLNFLIEHRLKPDSYLLDVACGVLRTRGNFLRHLEEGHYCDVYTDEGMIARGTAQSVLTHLPINSI